ncbi:hypothetical protein AJ80_08507 [Polytolypa hystricis UAMH7299]|uniref:Protein YOP1 n=1 Tax=Polytolypa hystricis (strain UAMH7299) TaxID=1447883 RepID=A0A2B7WYN7_POLH7|nr:hypothetical protein AJ80_08507 [Polytolypa hystricis UAMH7299]
MFGIIADLLSSVLTILFPIFASYKALRSVDPSQLKPWLMYWVVMSIVLLIESWTYFIVGWFPFYSWIRLFALSYLVLPQTQGAKTLYLQYIDPFLLHHEREIEDFMAQTHESARAAGLEYFYKAVDLFREKVLNLPPMSKAEPAPPSASGVAASYAQSLLSRFSLPTAPVAASTLATPASDFYSLLTTTIAAVGSSGKSRDAQAEELSASGTLFPRDIASAPRSEQARYVASQRERLSVLLSAFDREHSNLQQRGGGRGVDEDLAYGSSYDFDGARHGGNGLRKNRSDHSFENIQPDEYVSSPSLSGERGFRRNGRDDGADFAQRSVEEIARASGVSYGR